MREGVENQRRGVRHARTTTGGLADLRKAFDDHRIAADQPGAHRPSQAEFPRGTPGGYSGRIEIAFRHHEDRESLETAELASSRAFLDLLAARGSASAVAASDPGASHAARWPRRATPPPATAAPATPRTSRRLPTGFIRRRRLLASQRRLFIWVMTPEGRIRSRTVEISQARLVELIR